MKRSMPGHSHRDQKNKSAHSEDDEQSLKRTEEERLRRRREWMIQQEREREHERLKRKKIWEFELEYARKRGLPLPKKPPHCSRSRSRSKSPQNPHRRKSISSASKTSILSEKLDGTTPVFRGPEGTQISVAELRRIKVDIHRNIPAENATGEIRRDIVNPEDVLLMRRPGEGSKPIFEREEIKSATKAEIEVEERRTIVAVDNENLENKFEASKKYTVVSRSRSHSSRRTLSRHSRHEDSRHDDRHFHRSDRERRRSRNRSREHNRRRSRSSDSEDFYLRESRRKSHRDHSRSRAREGKRWNRDSHHRSLKDEKSYREHRERSRERSRDRNERNRCRECGVPPPHYIEQIPVPVYYGNIPPRPIMFGPLVPMRPQVPLGGRHPPVMGAMRPYPPRFVPPDMYRIRPPPNHRYSPMY